MGKQKITQNDRRMLYNRMISKGENKNERTGAVLGHAFAKAGGYLTGADIVQLTNPKSYEEMLRLGLIEKYETLEIHSRSTRQEMSRNELRQFKRENTIYIATSRLIKLYKAQTDSNAIFSRCGSVRHALIQKDVYMKLDRETRMTFLNEKELERLYDEKKEAFITSSRDRELSQEERLIALSKLDKMNELRNEGKLQLVDFAYKSDGEFVFGEAITENYTQNDLLAKSAFVEALGYCEQQLTFYK